MREHVATREPFDLWYKNSKKRDEVYRQAKEILYRICYGLDADHHGYKIGVNRKCWVLIYGSGSGKGGIEKS